MRALALESMKSNSRMHSDSKKRRSLSLCFLPPVMRSVKNQKSEIGKWIKKTQKMKSVLRNRDQMEK